MSADPNFCLRWQGWTIWFAQMTAAFGRWCRVDRDSLNIPSCGSQARKGVNQWTYARGCEKRPNCDGSLKIARISATRRPRKNAKFRTRIVIEHAPRTCNLSLFIDLFILYNNCSIKTRWCGWFSQAVRALGSSLHTY